MDTLQQIGLAIAAIAGFGAGLTTMYIAALIIDWKTDREEERA